MIKGFFEFLDIIKIAFIVGVVVAVTWGMCSGLLALWAAILAGQ